MIPTMILLGLVLGRWWKSALAVAAVGWPAILLVDGVINVAQVWAAAVFALANSAVGVGIHQGGAWLVRRVRPHTVDAADGPTE